MTTRMTPVLRQAMKQTTEQRPPKKRRLIMTSSRRRPRAIGGGHLRGRYALCTSWPRSFAFGPRLATATSGSWMPTPMKPRNCGAYAKITTSATELQEMVRTSSARARACGALRLPTIAMGKVELLRSCSVWQRNSLLMFSFFAPA